MANMLYNGVEMPALPEWDKTTYPYAYMQVLDASELDPSVSGTIVGLTARNKKAVFGSVSDDCLTTTAPYNEVIFIWTDSQGVCDLYADIGMVLSLAEWNSFGESTYESDSNDVLAVTWSNYDILNADGSIYLAASTPVPVGVNGDGMALYNGVMLPNIDSVWTDKEMYPYAFIRYVDATPYGFGGQYLYQVITCSTPIKRSVDTGDFVLKHDGNLFMQDHVYVTSEELANFVIANTGWKYAGHSGVWGSSEAKKTNGPSYAYGSDDMDGLWANHDIVNGVPGTGSAFTPDGSVYLAASDPIPLDGMNVITWDGDETGFVSVDIGDGNCLCKMADAPEDVYSLGGGYAVFTDGTDTETVLIGSDDVVTLGENLYMVGSLVFVALADNVSLYDITIPEKGIYLPREGGAYVCAFAYPASSGGEGDTSDFPTFYIGVEGKARKVKAAYIGVDGVARKVTKIYVGVDGKARSI